MGASAWRGRFSCNRSPVSFRPKKVRPIVSKTHSLLYGDGDHGQPETPRLILGMWDLGAMVVKPQFIGRPLS